MRIKFGLLLGALALAALGIVQSAQAQTGNWYWACHRGRIILINEAAVPAHEAHGDETAHNSEQPPLCF